MKNPLVLLALAALFAACPNPDPADDGGTVQPPCLGCDLVCPTGFVAMDGGAGCIMLRTLGTCTAGSMPKLGTTECTPVGVRSCPMGFVADSSGWGCRDVIAQVRCTGATREKLGSSTCVPVGDCAAAFPPPNATHFVSAAYTAGQLDGTHFDTIASALADAGAGAVVAVDEGTYVGSVIPAQPVTLVGKCAERVIVVPTDGGTNVGLRFVDVSGSTVKGFTVRGFPGGVVVSGGTVTMEGLVVEGNTIAGVLATNGGTQLTVRDSVLRGNRARPADRQAAGAYVQRGAVLTLEEVSLSDNEFVGAVATNPDAGLIIRRSVIRDTFPIAQGPVVGTFGVGAYAVDAAWLRLEESAVLNNVGEGVLFARGGTRPSSGAVLRSVVRDTTLNAMTQVARGIEVGKGSTAHLEECTVTGNFEHEILVTEEARATILNTTTVGSTNVGAPSGTGLLVAYDAGVVATSLAVATPRAVGVGVEEKGTLELNDAFVTRPVLAAGFGTTVGPTAQTVNMRTQGALTMRGGVLHGAQGVSVLVDRSRAALDGVAIVDTAPRYSESGRGVAVQEQAVFTAVNSAFIGNHEAGIVVFDPGTVASLTNTSIEETKRDGLGQFGIGALATTESSLELNACTVTRSASIGIAASESQVAVRASFVSFNETAVHGQDGVTVSTSAQVSLAPNVLGVTEDTRFIGNGQTTGLGTVVLPSK
jgi:Right handed beta helix region